MDPYDDSALTDRESHRLAVTQQLLTSLEDVVWRYRTFAARAELTDLCAEAVTAEVAHHLALARASLSRHPALPTTVTRPAASVADTSRAQGRRVASPRGRGGCIAPARTALPGAEAADRTG